MAPAVGETPDGVKTIRFGVLKLVWFRMLKNSARNCRFNRSLTLVSLMAEKSQSKRPGPVSVSRPKFP